ncbi:MAG: DUF7619 domain-containing protein [Chitinophagaceae bacterium]
MRQLFFPLLFLIITISTANSQSCSGATQLNLLGKKNSGLFNQLQFVSFSPNDGDPSQNEIIAEAWTCNSMGFPTCNFRSIIRYDLSQIPTNAIITSAKLYLFARTNSTNAIVGSPTYGANNAVSISRVITKWDTSGVGLGWNNQPLTDSNMQVILPSSSNTAQNYVADVTNLVQYWTNIPDSNFGMRLKMITETYYKSMIFHSGTSVDAVKPRLEICYFTEEQFPKVYGIAYYDVNNNGIKDSAEAIAPFIKVTLSNGNTTFTDINGYYEITTSVFGNYDVTVTPPNFFTATNLVSQVNLNSYGVTIENNVGFTVTSNTDSINIHIIPFHRFARPGFSFPCFFEYENLGSTTLTPTFGATYDSLFIFDSCNNAVIQNTTPYLNGTLGNVATGDRHFFIANFTTSTSAQIGDTLQLDGGIYAGTSAYATESIYIPVNGSFDPNDIEATPKLTPQQLTLGKYVDYTIRFENIGNDTAFNVVIKDTLSNLLQASSLQVISSSHPCKFTVAGNKIKIEFKNIKLLYTSLNALKSLGFVKFRVKPLSSLSVGTIIPNKASIYFDFNKPIITNTATTTISYIGTVTPVKILGYEVTQKNSNSVLNTWTTSNEINITSFNIERSINGHDFTQIGRVQAKNTLDNTYQFSDNNLPVLTKNLIIYYRLKIVENDGKISYSSTKKIRLNYNENAVSIYPNPTKNVVSIRCKNAKQICIIDCLGRVAKHYNHPLDNYSINTSELSKGIYTVRITTLGGNIFNKKMIIE